MKQRVLHRIILGLGFVFSVMLTVTGLHNPGTVLHLHAAESNQSSGRSSVTKCSMSELRNEFKSLPAYSTLYQTTPVLSGGNYSPATLTAEAYQSALKRINFYRKTAGLAAVSFTNSLNESAAYGALADAAINKLSHYPTQPSDMPDDIYEKGYAATTSSNLSYSMGYGQSRILSVAIDGQMADSSSGNASVLGHRRWLINPGVATMGIGAANNGSAYYTDIRVFGSGVSTTTVTDYNFVAWPASGDNLNDIFQIENPWSITLNPSKYKTSSSYLSTSKVSVKLTRTATGQSWIFNGSTGSTYSETSNYYTIDTNGYGVSNAIIFRPAYAGMGAYYGEYEVEVTGLTNASGSTDSLHYKVNFEPAEAALSSCNITLDTGTFTYDGQEKRPSAVVKYGDNSLLEGKDYTVSYQSNINAGTAKAVITGKGGFSGTVTKSFTIEKASQNPTLSLAKNSLSYKDTTSIKAESGFGDVTWSSSDETVAKVDTKGNVICNGKGSVLLKASFAGDSNHKAGEGSIQVSVNALSLSLADVEDVENQVYTGEAFMPLPQLTYSAQKLVKDIDYTITYENNVNAGTATIILTGKNNTTGSIRKSFEIAKAEQDLRVSVKKREIEYLSQEAIETESEGKINFKSSMPSVATVDETGMIQALQCGKTTITITAEETENYNMSVSTVEIDVIPVTLTASMINKIDSVDYTGNALTPDITVMHFGHILDKNKDYTISYSNNVNAGQGTVTIQGKGNYTGSASAKFTIQKIKQELTVNVEEDSLEYKSTGRIHAQGKGNITYFSENEEVATVDTEGIVTATGQGFVLIQVYAEGDQNYYPSVENVLFTVTPIMISDSMVNTPAQEIYSGQEKTPKMTVTYGGLPLEIEKDYTVSYQNNLNAGTATVTVKGVGGCSGIVEKQFTIAKARQNMEAVLQKDEISYGDQTHIQVSGVFAATYESADHQIASVDSNGNIRGIGIGTTTILVDSPETENYYGAQKSVTIRVKKAQNAPNQPEKSLKADHKVTCLTELSLPAGWSFTEEQSIPAGDSVTATAIYQDTEHYENYSVEMTISRDACNMEDEILVTDEEATCLKEGRGHTVCGICRQTIQKEVTLAKMSHHWDSGVITREATVSAEGIKTFTCGLCGQTKEESVAKLPTMISANGVSSADVSAQLAVDPVTAVEITKVAEKYNVSMDTLKVNKAVITKRKSDQDIPGSMFDGLMARGSSSAKTSIKISWKKVSGASGYMIYGNKCGKSNSMKLLATASKTKTSYLHKKLKKGTYYKYMVVAYKNINGNKVSLRVSKIIHICTLGGKYVNPSKVTISKVGTKAKASSLTLKSKTKAAIKAKESAGKKKIQKHRVLSYESSNAEIAKVSSTGVITAMKKGSCKVYVYAQNGLYKVIQITVK